MHVMVWIQLVVLPACYFLTCLCFHAKLLWMKVWTCVQLAVLENLQFKDASEGGGLQFGFCIMCCSNAMQSGMLI